MNIAQPESVARAQRGVTLIELIVAMVVVGVLAAIAIPSYQNYTLKAHRTEAKSTLLDMASLEERFFSTNQFYSSTLSDLGFPIGAATPYTVGSGYYQITTFGVTAATPPTGTTPGIPATYNITLTYYGNQMKDVSCASFSINSAGQQTATGTDPNPNVDCWK